MGANYSHTSRPDGTVLTGAMYDADHQNHIDNATPSIFDDYSTNATQMRSTVDPGEAGSESLATSLAGELERLRHQVKELKEFVYGSAPAQWYTTLAHSITRMQSTVDPGEVGTESISTSLWGEIERIHFALKELKDNINGSSVAQWYTTLLKDFTTSKVTNGYTKLANGLIIQWGYFVFGTTTGGTLGATQGAQFTFPLSFPTAAFAIFGSPNISGLGSSGNENIEHISSYGVVNNATGQCDILRVHGGNVGGEAFGFNYLVIGH